MFCFLCNDQKIGNEITSNAHLLPATNANYIDGLAIFAYMNLTRCLFLSLSPFIIFVLVHIFQLTPFVFLLVPLHNSDPQGRITATIIQLKQKTCSNHGHFLLKGSKQNHTRDP